MVIASLAMTVQNINTVKADETQSSDQTTATLNIDSAKDDETQSSNQATTTLNVGSAKVDETNDTQTTNEQGHETAPAGATVFARDSSKGPGYYKVASKSDYLFGNMLASASSQQSFLSAIKAGAIDGWKTNKILPSITAAQAIIESGWGSSISGTNNIFGIKGTPGTLCWTREVDANGNSYQTQAYFKNFSSLTECIKYHNSLLGTSSIYQGMSGQKNYRIAAQSLKAYATDPNYVNTIINTIEMYGLNSWDNEAFNQTDFPHTAVDTSVITIKYIQNYGVLAFHSSGASIGGSNKTFIDGTKWQTAGSKVINGEEMYQVSPDEYIPMKYTTVGADGTVTINYTQGYGVLGYHLNGASIPGSNQTLKTGSVWKTSGAAMINGQIMYQIATDEYVPKEFTQFGNGK